MFIVQLSFFSIFLDAGLMACSALHILCDFSNFLFFELLVIFTDLPDIKCVFFFHHIGPIFFVVLLKLQIAALYIKMFLHVLDHGFDEIFCQIFGLDFSGGNRFLRKNHLFNLGFLLLLKGACLRIWLVFFTYHWIRVFALVNFIYFHLVFLIKGLIIVCSVSIFWFPQITSYRFICI